MKAYTDITQSKQLAEFLPLDSADMYWSRCTITDFGDGTLKVSYAVEPCNISQFKNTDDDIPCWSLAALLEIIRRLSYYGIRLKFSRSMFDCFGSYRENMWCIAVNTSETEPPTDFNIYADNALDAAVNVILKLHEQGLL